MTVRVYVPVDSAAVAAGANRVARALAAHPDIAIVRNGSRGLFWLEPMVEVVTPGGRIAYGPVKPGDVEGLLASGMLEGGAHPLRLGRPEDIPYLARQTRLTFERVGVTDPLDIADYRAHGGFVGLKNAIAMTGEAITELVTKSGLRGRGGAGFPTGIKWTTVRKAGADQKYIVCNADEGDSGTFADRMVMEGDPFCLIEGMTIAGLAVGATEGYIYLRSEYPYAYRALLRAIDVATADGVLGDSVLGCGRAFRLHVRLGAGAYICGEETSLLESLEGRRGVVRAKPPLPALQGLFGKPTVVNNPVRAAMVGGPLGAYFPPSLFDTPMDYEAFAAAGGLIGHGGVVLFDDTVDMAKQARFAFEFCETESCGKCTPCRVGATRGRETMEQIIAGRNVERNLTLIEDLCVTMTDGSLCAMGGLTPVPVKSALTHFPEDFVPAERRQAAE